jgi:cytochrome c-type biogenesis protein
MDVASLSASGLPVLSAIGLGLLCAVSPCTMATNVAALAYVGRNAPRRWHAATTAVLYTLGRAVTYTAIGLLILLFGLEVSGLSRALQSIGGKFLGPFLIAIGLAMFFIHKLPVIPSGAALQRLGARFGDMGVVGGLPLGAILALAFCPYSGVLFFAVLIPLALRTSGGIVLPAVFALGSGVPVLVFGLLLSFWTSYTASAVDALGRADRFIRFAAAVVFILAGAYCLVAA